MTNSLRDSPKPIFIRTKRKWAMKESEIAQTVPTAEGLNGSDSANGAVFSLNLPEEER